MPRTRKTFEEQIGLLSGKRSELNTRIETLRSRQNGTRRKLDTRRKIIAGALVLTHANVNRDYAKELSALFDKCLAPKDRAIFMELMQEWRRPSGAAAVPATGSLQPHNIREDTGRHKRLDRPPGL